MLIKLCDYCEKKMGENEAIPDGFKVVSIHQFGDNHEGEPGVMGIQYEAHGVRVELEQGIYHPDCLKTIAALRLIEAAKLLDPSVNKRGPKGKRKPKAVDDGGMSGAPATPAEPTPAKKCPRHKWLPSFAKCGGCEDIEGCESAVLGDRA